MKDCLTIQTFGSGPTETALCTQWSVPTTSVQIVGGVNVSSLDFSLFASFFLGFAGFVAFTYLLKR